MQAGEILQFYGSLPQLKVPKGVEVLNPYRNEETSMLVKAFYDKYYSDNKTRTLLLGINPGRFGAGVTGISFTDPIRLERDCGIANDIAKKPELSSDFIYRMIDRFGGPQKFYSKYFISAVSPLGFMRHGKNINYYDDNKLKKAVRPFAIECITRLVKLGVNREKCFCIGEGKNLKFLEELNRANKWFAQIIPLAHPRFIMQYRRKELEGYISEYVEKLRGVR
jgi:hypothetical protein